jgi:hypothetical protein
MPRGLLLIPEGEFPHQEKAESDEVANHGVVGFLGTLF